MSDARVPVDESAIAAAAWYDEALAQGWESSDAVTHLDPELAKLIRSLREQLGPKPSRLSATSGSPGRNYGRFRLIRRLGAGTYGVVYLADDPVLKREVALKIPRPQTLESEDLRRRFVREAQAAARLKHPHLVQVFQADVEGDGAYIATEYCAGPNLETWLRRRTAPVSPLIAAEIVANLAQALGCAHASRILHRDVKPGNVLLAENVADEAVVPRHVRLTDFGMARLLEQEAGTATADGALIGTFAYMAPEQVHRSHGEVGPHTDVHALGALLYELLTLQNPFRGENHSECLLRVCNEIPRAPRQLVTDLPRDLEAICFKCMEKSPRLRYVDGNDLHEDLRRFLAGEPVRARQPRFRETCRRLVRRHPTATALVSTVALATTIVLVLLARHSSVQGQAALRLREANSQLQTSNTQLAAALADAKLAHDDARDAVYSHDLRQAFGAADSGDARMVINLLSKYADDTPLAKYRGVEWNYLWLRFRRSGRELFRTAQPQYMTALSADQRRLALVGADGVVRVFAWPGGQLLAEWSAQQGEVNGICFSPDGTQIWSAGDDGSLCRWDLATHGLQIRFNAHGPELAFEVVHDIARRRLFSCGREGTIRIWDDETGAALGTLEGHTGTVDTLQLSPDGQTLYSQSKDETLRFWDLASLTCRRVISTTPHRISYLRTSPDGRWLAASAPSSRLMMFDLHTGDQVLDESTLNEPTRLCFDDSSRRLFVGDLIGVIREWELNSEDAHWTMTKIEWQAHGDEISQLNWSSGTGELISVGRDGLMHAWRAQEFETPLQREFHHPDIRDMVAIPGTERLLIACRDGIVLEPLVEPQAIAPAREADWLHRGPEWQCLAAASDAHWFAAGDAAGRVAIWNNLSNRPVHEVDVFEGRIHCLAFAPDGRGLYATTIGSRDPVWIDLENGRTDSVTLGCPCNRLVFSPFGRTFAAAFENQLNVAQVEERRVLCTLPEASLHNHLFAFLPDAGTLIVGHERSARAFDTHTGHMRREYLGHQGNLQGLAISQDGRTLATASLEDGTVRLWRISTGEQLASFPVADRSGVNSTGVALCSFSHGDEHLAYSLDKDHLRVVRMR